MCGGRHDLLDTLHCEKSLGRSHHTPLCAFSAQSKQQHHPAAHPAAVVGHGRQGLRLQQHVACLNSEVAVKYCFEQGLQQHLRTSCTSCIACDAAPSGPRCSPCSRAEGEHLCERPCAAMPLTSPIISAPSSPTPWNTRIVAPTWVATTRARCRLVSIVLPAAPTWPNVILVVVAPSAPPSAAASSVASTVVPATCLSPSSATCLVPSVV